MRQNRASANFCMVSKIVRRNEENAMTGKKTIDSSNMLARMAGILYFLVVLAGISSEITCKVIFVPGDIAATVNHILAHEFIFRLGFVFSLVRHPLLILLVLALYRLLRPVNKDLAVVMAAFALISIPIGMASLLFKFATPLLLSSSDYSGLFTADQWHAQALFFINLQVWGDRVSQVLAVWLCPFGYLVYKSGFLPKILGILLIIAGLGYLADCLVFFLLPNLNWQVAGFAFLGELPFPLWLLMKGINVERWRSRALEAA
jgi:hypothetical protein